MSAQAINHPVDAAVFKAQSGYMDVMQEKNRIKQKYLEKNKPYQETFDLMAFEIATLRRQLGK